MSDERAADALRNAADAARDEFVVSTRHGDGGDCAEVLGDDRIEAVISEVVRRSCHEEAPSQLRERVIVALQECCAAERTRRSRG